LDGKFTLSITLSGNKAVLATEKAPRAMDAYRRINLCLIAWLMTTFFGSIHV
jgi:hypothetical protein